MFAFFPDVFFDILVNVNPFLNFKIVNFFCASVVVIMFYTYLLQNRNLLIPVFLKLDQHFKQK